jgi:hypothetical protein
MIWLRPQIFGKVYQLTMRESPKVTQLKQIAAQGKTTADNVVSTLLRESLKPKRFDLEYRNGVPMLPRRPNGSGVTAELVNRLLSEDE